MINEILTGFCGETSPKTENISELEKNVLAKVFRDIVEGGFSEDREDCVKQRTVVVGDGTEPQFSVFAREWTYLNSKSYCRIIDEYFQSNGAKRRIYFEYNRETGVSSVKYSLICDLGLSESGHEITKEKPFPEELRLPFLNEILEAKPMWDDTAYEMAKMTGRNGSPKWINPENNREFDWNEFNVLCQARWAARAALKN